MANINLFSAELHYNLMHLAEHKNNNMNLVGRKIEKKIMDRLLTDNDSNFLAVYGRRRMGKTYLICQF